MIPRDLRTQLVTLILKVPGIDTHLSRTTLLNGIPHQVLDRREGNARDDVELLVTQLMRLGVRDDDQHCLLIFVENAIEKVDGTTLATELQEVHVGLQRIIRQSGRERLSRPRYSDAVLMDRKNEVELYRRMLSQQDPARFLFIQGDPKMGKTRLMREFRRIAEGPRQLSCALVDVRTRGQNYREVLDVITREIGIHHFPEYSERARRLSSRSMSPGSLSDDNLHQLVMLLAAQNQIERNDLDRQLQLTQAFIRDLRLLCQTQQVILLFDAFEEASEETQRWLCQELLLDLYKIPNMLGVVAGRVLPEIEINIQDVTVTTELSAVTQEDYRVYCRDIGVTELDDTAIDLFYRAFTGSPGSFAEVAGNFVPDEGRS